jgi:hypothetical protein
MNTGIFPDHLKILIIKPLYKEGDKSCVTNYRSISLLTAFSKVLEKVMYMSYYMHINNILVPEQFGFRKGLSTENAAFELTDNIFKLLTKKCMLEEYFVI